MWYLFFQMWLWVLASFVLGWFAHWFLCCRRSASEEIDQGHASKAADSPSKEAPLETSSDIEGSAQPIGYSAVPEVNDDLKRIRGIGAVNEKALNGLGIYQFSQIAEWSSENVQWVEGFLAFPGRITREDWVTQARVLASGGTTEFAKKVDDGEVDYPTS